MSVAERIFKAQSFKGLSDDCLAHEILPTEHDKTCFTNCSYGKIVALPKIGAVAKVTPYGQELDGVLDSPYRSEYSQCIMHRLLANLVVEPMRSPHICLMWGQPYPMVQLAPKKWASVMVLEECDRYDAYKFLTSLSGTVHYLDDYVRQILFEVAYTLESIYKVLPDFRHNDLKPTNVMIHTANVDDAATQYAVNGSLFTVPHELGFTSRMGDFDFACCRGVVDNYKVFEFWCMNPSYNIGFKRNHTADLGMFVKQLYAWFESRLSPAFKRDLYASFNKQYLHMYLRSKMNILRAPPHCDDQVPTPATFLQTSPLFQCYRRPEIPYRIAECFKSTPLKAPKEKIAWPHFARRSTYNRVVPLFNCEGNLNLPSKAFFQQLACVKNYKYEGDWKAAKITKLWKKATIQAQRRDIICTSASHTFKKERSLLCRDSAWWEALSVCFLLDAILYEHAYEIGLVANGCDDWVLHMGERYTVDQMLQVVLQYSWRP